MNNWTLRLLFVGIVVSGMSAGCVVEFDPPPEDVTGPDLDFEVPDGYSTIVFTSESPVGHTEVMAPVDSRGEGPCACSTHECLQDWVDSTFGCNICVAVVCAGSGSHVCSSTCDSNPSPTLTDPDHPTHPQ